MISLFSVRPTEEQLDIIRTVAKGENLVINAFAGSGKTTTLEMIAEEMNNKRILYLVYNKSMEQEAKKRFKQEYVKITTIHSLAYRYMTYSLDLKNRQLGNVSYLDVANKLNIDPRIAKLALETYKYYLNSDLVEMNKYKLLSYLANEPNYLVNVLEEYARSALSYDKFVLLMNSESKDRINKFLKEHVLGKCFDIIKEIDNMISHGELTMPHDYYLKQFHIALLNNQVKMKDYDLVLLDEAQDSNDVTMAIIANLSGQKICVGDRYQNIYSFRGSKNVMDILPFTQKFLRVSFRFGSNIANELNKLVKTYLNEDIEIIGVGGNKHTGRDAYIARSNSFLIKLISKLNSFFLTRDISEVFEPLINIHYIVTGQRDKVSNKFSYMTRFHSISEILDFAKHVNDVELINAAETYQIFRGGIFDLKNKAKSCNDVNANIVLTTAHSSKGLEFDKCYVCDDFAENIARYNDNLITSQYKYRQEVNTYYVACSRAIKDNIHFC